MATGAVVIEGIVGRNFGYESRFKDVNRDGIFPEQKSVDIWVGYWMSESDNHSKIS